jgi:RNA polymerase sigma factor (sigma-70 family)
MDVLPDVADDQEYDTTGDRVLDIVDTLALPEKILWDLYYVQGLTTRKIAKMHNLSHTGVAKQIQRLQKMIQKEL